MLSNLSFSELPASLELHSMLDPLFGLWPNPLHASALVYDLQQHTPLVLGNGYSLLWQGHELQPSVLLLMLLH